jgi:hypothetical protein
MQTLPLVGGTWRSRGTESPHHRPMICCLSDPATPCPSTACQREKNMWAPRGHKLPKLVRCRPERIQYSDIIDLDGASCGIKNRTRISLKSMFRIFDRVWFFSPASCNLRNWQWPLPEGDVGFGGVGHCFDEGDGCTPYRSLTLSAGNSIRACEARLRHSGRCAYGKVAHASLGIECKCVVADYSWPLDLAQR